jgi:hypothetical protein
MASFRDRALLALSDNARLAAALIPPGDTDRQLVRTLLAATYDLSAARIDQVSGAAVREIGLERPIFPVSRRRGNWSQLVPCYTRSEFTADVTTATPVWIDLLAQLSVTVVAEVDPGGAESVLARGLQDFTSFDEFRARFRFIDLDAFLAKHRISTVEELREAFEYVVTEVHLRTPGPFNPSDPANTHVLPVTLAAVVVDPFDLAEGLRAARLIQEAAQDVVGAQPTSVPAEVVAAYATAVVFASDGLGAGGPSPTDVTQLFAREGVVSLFVT